MLPHPGWLLPRIPNKALSRTSGVLIAPPLRGTAAPTSNKLPGKGGVSPDINLNQLLLSTLQELLFAPSSVPVPSSAAKASNSAANTGALTLPVSPSVSPPREGKGAP